MVASLAALLLAVAPPWRVEVSPVVACPDRVMVERALERRGPPARPGWRVQLDGAGEGTLRLILRQPAGEAALERELHRQGTGCESAADAVAVVVERYFRELDWSAPPAPATVVAAPPSPPRRENLARALLLLGPMVRDGSLAAALELRLRVAGPLHVGLGGALPAATTSEALPGGEARLSRWPFLLRALGETRGNRWALSGGLDGVIGFERGTTRGIAQPSSRTRWTVAAGAVAGVAWLPAPRLRVAAEVGLDRLLAGNDFQVEGYGRVLAPPPWQGMAALRLGWALWP
jgi:hypothetical protein